MNGKMGGHGNVERGNGYKNEMETENHNNIDKTETLINNNSPTKHAI